jgi:uncharacterized zinc-type alcohol dehydrogenase-like protein
MCDHSDHRDHAPAMLGRRDALRAGAALAAAPLLAGLPGAASATESHAAVGARPFATRAWGVTSATGPVRRLEITRRAVRPNDVLVDVLYVGICHSDIHVARGDWAPPQVPCVPGHEIVGRVAAVGSAVTKFKVGDIAGVGCMVDSCGTCESCRADREQHCLNGATFTYDAPDKVSGGHTYGGYSDQIVVAEHFVIRIPPGADLAATAPLLCAGITTFSPMQHWELRAGQRVGVIGLGGLGHMAVKLAARGADVTVFTTSSGKLADARRLGAKEAVLSTDAEAMKRQASRFDLLICAVPVSIPLQPYLDVLKLDGTLVNVGALGELGGLSGMAMAFGRKSLAGSMIGGIAETQEVIDYCAARKITADIELVRPNEINRAWDRVRNKDVRYRFVIDVKGR